MAERTGDRTPLLSLDRVHCYHGSLHVLRDIRFEVREGEIVTLIGANGAGKSTALMAISGLVPPRLGHITFRGERIEGLAPAQVVARGISQVPEGRRILPELSVLENLLLGAYLRRDRDGIRRDLDGVLSMFPILAERRHQAGGTLSGGEQQMLAISRALMARPRLLLLDEPSLGLAPIVIGQIFDIIRKIRTERAAAVLLVEQNANQALRIADRGLVMESGAIVLEGRAADLLHDPAVRQAYLGL